MALVRLIALVLVLIWIVWDASDSETRIDVLGIVLVVLLGLGLVTFRHKTGAWDRWRTTMVAALVGLAIWSFMSITWADFPGVAWSGANRTLIYVVVFVLFAAWPSGIREREALLTLVALTIGAVGLIVAFRILLASPPGDLVGGGRLSSPLPYANGDAALFVLGTIPTLMLAVRPGRPSWMRAFFLGSATLLTGLAVLTQSRGWLLGLPVAIVIAVLCARRRLRLALGIVLVGATVVPAVLALNGVFDRFWNDRATFEPALDHALAILLIAAAVSALAGLAWGLADGRIHISPQVHRSLGIAAIICLVLGLVGTASVASAVVGNPQVWVKSRWHEFTGGFTGSVTGSRLTSSVGSGRYELWTTAVHEFADHPLIGSGADNFAAAHLLRRSTGSNQPLHPHSTPLRILSQLGLVGAGLFAVGIGIGLWRGFSRRRRTPAAGGDIVGASLAMALFWLIQGSIDVLWEIPAIAGLAVAMLGLAAAPIRPAPAAELSRPVRRAIVPLGLIILGCAAASLTFTGLSDAYVRSARSVGATDVHEAYRRFDRAAALKPLSGFPLTQKGLLALDVGDYDTARRAFERSLSREAKNWFPYMQLGLVAGATGQYEEAATYLERAHELNPRDALIQIASDIVAIHGVVDHRLFNRLYDEGLYIAGRDWLIDNYFQIPPFTDE